ncbi:hypothetical protein FRC12_024941 [Ceratobasidium sp. 428]|nr:hypothetical protein FRC12_024941 [Ceratobasidium sp. 428]
MTFQIPPFNSVVWYTAVAARERRQSSDYQHFPSVSSYESVVKKPVVCISSSDDQKAKKKRKPERPGKRSKSESEENLSEIGAKSTSDRKASEKGMSEQKEKSAISTKKLAEDKKNASVSSLEQIRSTTSKAKKWSGTRRRSNSELTAAIKA